MTSSSDFKNHITMLGTGSALATRCYNTCFTLHSSGGAVLMVDAGGGNRQRRHTKDASSCQTILK